MTRRSVTLPPDLERAVRRLQARLLTEIDRDISFNETLNLALAAAFSVPELAGQVDLDQWSTLLDGSEWQSNGTITEAGLQVLECIVPPSSAKPSRSGVTRGPKEKIAHAKGAEAAVASVPPAEAESSSLTVASIGGPAVPSSAVAPEPAAEIFVERWPEQKASTDEVIADEHDADLPRTPQERRVAGAPVVGEPLAVVAEDVSALDDTTPVEQLDVPLLGRPYGSVGEAIGNADAVDDPAVAEQRGTPFISFEEPPAVETELEAREPEAEPAPPAHPERAFGGGMDLDALRQAIVAGETDPQQATAAGVARPESPRPPRDGTDFASMMAGYMPSGATRNENEIIVPEIVLSASDTAADAHDSPIPPSSDTDAVVIGEDEAPSPFAEEAEEPVVKPPADQAADYLDLDRALKDAAAAYEERLRNSGAS
ncbi:MAG: hypothetical protein O2884_03235 [Chloroflexi bacterium]|nr:hypothetical protein [Chloroflexota bacterium]